MFYDFNACVYLGYLTSIVGVVILFLVAFVGCFVVFDSFGNFLVGCFVCQWFIVIWLCLRVWVCLCCCWLIVLFVRFFCGCGFCFADLWVMLCVYCYCIVTFTFYECCALLSGVGLLVVWFGCYYLL